MSQNIWDPFVDIKENVTDVPIREEWKTWQEVPELKLDVKDETLVEITDKWIQRASKSKTELDKRYKDSKKYYLWIQMWQNRRINDNRIFLSVETIVPIATSSPPAPNVLPAQDTIESRTLARSWEKLLTNEYRVQKMQRKMEKAVRHMAASNYCVFKTWFDVEKDQIMTTVVHPKDFIFDNDRNLDFWLDWAAEQKVDTAENLIKLFPNKKREISEEVGGELWTEIVYTEFWTNDMVIWRFKRVILNKVKNPNYNHSNKSKNFLDMPKMPYVIVNLFDLWETVSWETSLIQQAKTLQDGVDKRKNQIDMNASIVNWKIVATWANGLKEKDFANIDWNDPEEYIFMSDWEVGDIKREGWSPLPQFVESDMHDSRWEIDNVMWTHWTTRWEREWRETATWRQFLREADRWRIDVFWRRLEEALEELFKMWVQLIAVWYKKKKLVRFLSADGATEFIEFNSNSVEDGMEIAIIPWTLIPEDKASRQQRAMTLTNAQMLDPITVLEESWIQNAKEKAERLFKWNTNPASLFEWAEEWEEWEVNRQTQQADSENRAMMQWQPQPPFEDADWNHIAAHTALMESPDFANLPPEIQEIFVDHVEWEVAIVEGKAKKKI